MNGEIVASKSPKISICVYPWHDLAWDLALAEGMNPAEIERRFDQNSKNDRPRQPIPAGLSLAEIVKQTSEQLLLETECDKATASIEDEINTDISTHLWRDILEGKLLVRKANGNPLTGDSTQFKIRGPDTPHLTVAEGNEWLAKNRYLQVWIPCVLKKQKHVYGDATRTHDCEPAPVQSLGNDPAWCLKQPKRYQGYSKPLYDVLKAAHVDGKPSPKARDVLDVWAKKLPAEVTEIMSDGIKYYDANGNTKTADLAAIRATIKRITTP